MTLGYRFRIGSKGKVVTSAWFETFNACELALDAFVAANPPVHPSQRPCSICQKPGHRRNTCPQRPRREEAPPSGNGTVKARAMTLPDSDHVQGRERKEMRDHIESGETGYPDWVDRPLTRGDCEDMPRPCPFVSCSHHLYLDVNPETGALKINQPHLEVWEMAETCSLDLADRAGMTLEDVGAALSLTRERIRQVEVRGLIKIKNHTGHEIGIPPSRNVA